MIHTSDINIRMIIDVAKRLGDLRDKVVFVGGCATGLFITDPAIPEVRATQDVDVIVEVASDFLANDEFCDSIPGHLSPDRASQSRLPLLIKRLRK